ncbi:hypothetical protein [Poseidonocella sp. HB161398]|uniref:hypothetical protein n=1 Tax=Poseidonocella sp. HB161398 TaxID=2320855 RepID=UPI001108BFCC|nr:hypothetical protein [Poseidonocella sp. HB161398]
MTEDRARANDFSLPNARTLSDALCEIGNLALVGRSACDGDLADVPVGSRMRALECQFEHIERLVEEALDMASKAGALE